MIPHTFPSIIEAFQTKMVVYVLPSITGLRAWIDYIPVKGVVTESATLANTYANGGYQVVKSLDSLTGLQAWIGYIPVYEDAAYNKPWSTDAGGYIPVGGLFSIPSLFASGAKGVWYDPSDFSTLFQDSAGTTPVTAVEQPVGLMLDKSQGLVLGPELVVNGDFATDTGWTKEGGTTISGGVAVFNGTPGSSLIYRSAAVVIGKTYKITFTVTSRTSGTLTCRLFGGTSGFSATAPGTYVFYDTPTTINTNVGFYSSGGFVGTSDDISIKELPGNHAFQATSASRPVLSARYNLLTKTEQFSDSAWSKTGVTLGSLVTAPDGTTTAQSITYTSGGGISNFQYFNAAPIGVTPFGSIWIRSSAPLTMTLGFFDGGAFDAPVSVTSTWTLFTYAKATAFSSADRRFWLYPTNAGSNITVEIWHPQVVPTNQSTLPYQRVNTATDYATTGFLPYLRFDGVDDSLSTNSISFTSTDKMSVFAGVRKLDTSANNNMIVELSSDLGAATGVFNLYASSDRFRYGLKQSAAAVYDATTYNSPITVVTSVIYDMAGAAIAQEIFPRINGAVPTLTVAAAGPAGSGNFGNYPLYIGRRGGSSLPFNGQLYSMVIVGKAVTASELSSTETYVNQKTGAY